VVLLKLKKNERHFLLCILCVCELEISYFNSNKIVYVYDAKVFWIVTVILCL